MRFLSHLSMAVALAAVATLAVATAPQEAQAAKKKKEKKPAKVKLSKEIKPKGAAIQEAMAGETPATAKPLVEALLAEPLVGDDQFFAGQLAFQLGSKLNDAELQEKGINAFLASGKTDAAQVPIFTFFSGNFAYGAGRYAEAQQKFQAAFDAGYRKNSIGALIAEAYFKENKYQQGLAALNRAIQVESATGGKAEQAWYRRGAGVAMKSKIPGASAEWTYKLVEAYPTAVNWRAALSVYRDSANPKLSNRENLELMRLMRGADAMESERDYAEYADAADSRRLPGEVVSLLNEGIAKGRIRQSNTYISETLAAAKSRVGGDRASLPASERDANRSSNGKIALATADAFLGYSNYSKASSLYQIAMNKGGIDNARAHMGIGIAKAGAKDWTAAKQAFANVVGTRKSIANFWSLWIDQQTQPVAPVVAAAPAGG